MAGALGLLRTTEKVPDVSLDGFNVQGKFSRHTLERMLGSGKARRSVGVSWMWSVILYLGDQDNELKGDIE